MPYAAASQQPSTASPWHALVYTSAGDRGIIGFPGGLTKWRKKRAFINRHYSEYELGVKNCKKRLIFFYKNPSRFCSRFMRIKLKER
jgi:hypothetical protein